MPEELRLWSDATVDHAIHAEIPINQVLSVTNGNPASRGNFIYAPRWVGFNDAFISRCGTFLSLRFLQLHHFPPRHLRKLAFAVGTLIDQLDICFDHSTVEAQSQVLRFAGLRRLFVAVALLYSEERPASLEFPLIWDLPQLQRLDASNLDDKLLDSFAESR